MTTTNKVRCMECGAELESKYRHNFVSCSCPNGTFTDGGAAYQRIGGKDLSKIEVWNDETQTYEKTVL